MSLKVSEIFYSIQGESSWAGQPCVFVRLSGCNLRCEYCDTAYAYEDGRTMEIAEILEQVRGLSRRVFHAKTRKREEKDFFMFPGVPVGHEQLSRRVPTDHSPDMERREDAKIDDSCFPLQKAGSGAELFSHQPSSRELVEVTGGEPLMQKETPLLIENLLDAGYIVLLETNGSLDIDVVDQRCIRIVDIKCPSSGMAEKNDLSNLKKLRSQDELKFVIGSREDYEFARDVVATLPSILYKINFSPVFGSVAPRSLAEWILENRLPVRFNLQLHKIIWGPEARGV